MGDFQTEKKLVLELYKAIETTPTDRLGEVISGFVAKDYLWRGFHPFDEIRSASDVANLFWRPLHSSLTSLQRRLDIFLAGDNRLAGHEGVWVASMGHLMGLFDTAWLGIPPTGKIAMLRYAEFHRVDGGRITETAMYFDIPHLMMQAGLNPFPPQTGAHLVQPGPATHDGVMLDPQPDEEGRKTLAAIDYMVTDIKDWKGGRTESLPPSTIW